MDEAYVVAPPVEPNFLRLIDRAHQQANLDGQQLDVGQRDLDVARDDEPLVEHAIENVDQVRPGARGGGIAGQCVRPLIRVQRATCKVQTEGGKGASAAGFTVALL